jgi:Ca2+-transporting ATPase
VSFLTLGFAKLFFVFNLRDRGSRLWDNDVVKNPWIWVSIGLCAALLLAAVYLPGLSEVLKTRPIGWKSWFLVFTLGLIPMICGHLLHAFRGPSDGQIKTEGSRHAKEEDET